MVIKQVYYFSEVIKVEKKRYPKISHLEKIFNGPLKIIKVPVPFNCRDGFQEAFFGRPEAFLQKEIRRAQSAWGFVSPHLEEKMVKKLEKDLITGEWDRKYGEHRKMKKFTCALRLIIYKK